MFRYLAYSLTFLILISCGTNKIRLGKKHVHSKITTEQEIEPTTNSFNDLQPEAVSSPDYSERNTDSIGLETNDFKNVNTELDSEPDEIYLDQKETNQIDSTSRVKEEYPGFNKRRNRGQIFRIMLGVLFIVAGVLFAVGVFIASIGSYTPWGGIIAALLIGTLLVAIGILLVRIQVDKSNIKILGILVMIIGIALALFIVGVAIANGYFPFFAGVVVAIGGLLFWLGYSLFNRAKRYE